MDELKAEALFAWGRQDRHFPFAGREAIRARLEAVSAREEGPRYDPGLFLQSMGWMLALFQRTLSEGAV